MSSFDVDFSDSLRQLSEFQIRLANMGKALDTLEAKSGKSTSASARLLRDMNREYDKLEKTLIASGADAENLGRTMQTVRDNVNRLMAGMAAQNVKATVTAKALNGEYAEMGRLLRDTADKESYSKSVLRIAQASNNLKNENAALTNGIKLLNTEEGRLNNELKAVTATKQRLLNTDTKLRLVSVEQSAALSSLLTEQGRSNAIAQVTIRSKQQEITETARQDAQLKALERTLASLNGGRQEEITKIQAQIAARKSAIREELTEKKAVTELEMALKREESQLIRLRAQSQLMAGSHGKQVTAIRQQIAAQEQLNRLNAMSTSQLLGLGGSMTRVNVAQQAGAQTAAAFRAAITGLHASFGMYTSATVVAASATYAFTAGVRDSIVTGAEFYDTMQRTRAIMSSGGPQWMGDTGASFKAMEDQVRALGMTTVYTASEVGGGLQQLGMAGFSSSQAITALPASLQLANLANVSMARSADIATNVLMTFGMEARDLGNVVDLMATAVNNSNTDIEQLANALTYAGPAAQTAGYSLQETVAAIEALANSGFKASRAGTGLRRLMVSLLNPTEKGQAVLDKFGISVVDAEGNARGLVDVIGQLNKAFEGLSGPEQLGAVQDLVGVYATPQVSALIGQYNNLEKYTAQNQDVTGAGDRMEAIINDSLAKDWKQMLSAIEEVQLSAFQRLDLRLRTLTSNMSVEILSLLEPIGTLDSGESFTKLDQYLVQAESAVKAIGLGIAGMVAYKFASGNMFRGLSDDAGKAAERLKILSERFGATSASMNTLTPSIAASSTALRSQHAAALAASSGFGALSGAASVAAGALSRIATVGAIAMRALGWVGLLYGIGSALYEVFGSSAQDDLEANAAKVDKLRETYQGLREDIDDVGIASQRRALGSQIEADMEGIRKIQARLDDMRSTQAALKNAGLPQDNMIAGEITTLEALLGTYGNRVQESQKNLDELGESTTDYNDRLRAHGERLREIATLTRDLTSAQESLNRVTIGGGGQSGTAVTIRSNIAEIEARIAKAREGLLTSGKGISLAATQAKPASETFAALEQTAKADAEAAAYKKVATDAQKLLDVENKLVEARKAKTELIDKDNKALAEGNARARPGLREVTQAQEKIVGLEAERLELAEKVDEQSRVYERARRESDAKNLTDAENLSQAKARDLELSKQIAELEKPSDGKAKDIQHLTKLYNEQRSVREQINSLNKGSGRADNKAEREEARDLQTAIRQYEQLEKKIDPVGAAKTELRKSTEAMVLLRQKDIITVEQESKALAELRKAHHAATLAQDKQYQALLKLREAYGRSPFDTASADLAKMNALLRDGKIQLDEYSRLYSNMQKQQIEKATSGLPTANLSVGDASSTPFTDWVGVEVERAQGLGQFQARQKEIEDGLFLRTEAIRQEAEIRRAALAAEQLEAQAHSAKMLEIKKQENDQWLAAQQEFGVQYQAVSKEQAAYGEAMGKMALASAMGSAADLLGQFASAAEGASAAQKAAFVAQKALAIAQIIIYTEMAAAQAMAIPGDYTKVVGLSLASFIRATGYASAGLVAAQAIGSLAGGGGGSSPQMYDTGGTIPYNRVGIVGEYGPELVKGPAHVTGRGASAGRLGGGGGTGGIQVTIAPVTNVQMAPGSTGESSRQEAQQIAELVSTMTKKELQTQMRPNGMLDEWMRSKGSR